MKKSAIFIFIGLILISSATVFAQSSGSKIGFNLAGGPAIPVGELADGWGIGFHGGATFDLSLKGGFTIFADGRYQSFGLDTGDWDYPANATFSGGTFGIISITAGGKYFFPMQAKIKVYAMAGLGVFIQSLSDLTIRYRITTSWYTADVTETFKWTGSETDFGVLFGLGMQYPLGPKLSLLGEIRMNVIFTEDESTMYLPVIVGIVLHL